MNDFLDISQRLGKVRNRVYKVGVELEGGWRQIPKGVDHIERDGSVKFAAEQQAFDAIDMQRIAAGLLPRNRNRLPGLHVGELPSPILLPENLEKWLSHHYPQEVNKTCGMHVHMSFRNVFQYAQLMREDFTWTMIEFLRKWGLEAVGQNWIPADHCLFDRLSGNSEYCQLLYQADEQATKVRKEYDHHAPGHRYTAVNYAFSKTSTIEIRVLPMMPTAEIALSAIQRVMDITSAFLVDIAEKEQLVLEGRHAGRGEKPVESIWTLEHDPIRAERIEVTV
jgi:hypothetical protein